MGIEEWRRAQEILEAALELPDCEQSAYLEAELGSDAALREEVGSLREADGKTARFLETPALTAWLNWCRQGPGVAAGERIGAYEVLRPIGRGGMAVVLLGVRADDAYRKQVAIKVAHRIASAEELMRFRRERQILARLDHPNIARLHDGGTTEGGLPYLVMEYIEGTPIDQHCQRYELSLDQRLALFAQVCEAVAYAHRNLVVHRDLKPGNILITDQGEAKLLDFGIAKLLEPDRARGSENATTLGHRPMTLNYASPEQLRGDAITTASDVYSLGVILYRLLTNRLPFDFASLRLLEVERKMVEERPLPPSRVVAVPAWRRRGRPDSDLDKIVLMALRWEPERRYASVEQLAADLRRHAEGLPVEARQATLVYRAAKFVRRNRALLAASSLLLCLGVGFTATSVQQSRLLAEERDRAQVEGRKAQEAWSFLVELLEGADPRHARGQTVILREVLDRGAERIGQRLDGQPEVRATLLDTMGSIYLSLGHYDEAETLLVAGLEQRLRLLGGEHPEVALSLVHLGQLRRDVSEYEASEVAFRRALAIREAALGAEDPRVSDTLDELGETLYLLADYDEAEAVHRRALDLRVKAFGAEHPAVAASQHELAVLLAEKGELETGERLFREALAARRRLLGEDHPEVALTLTRLAYLVRRRGGLEEAELLLREALAIRRPIFGDDHMEVGQSLNNLASVLAEKGNLQEAEALYRRCLEILNQRVGGDHRDVAVTLSNLGRTLHAKGDLQEAIPPLTEALAIVRRILPEGHPGAAYPLGQLGEIRLDLGQPVRAEPLLAEALELRRKALPAGHPEVASSERLLARGLAALGRVEEAETLLRGSHGILQTVLGADHRETIAARRQLAELQRRKDF